MAENQGNNNNKQKPSERIEGVLGFNPVKRSPITDKVLSKVMEKVKEQKEKEAEAQAEAVVTQLLDLAKKQQKLRNDFNKADAAIEKEIGKQLNQLNSTQATEGEQQTEEGDAPKEQ